MLINRKNLRNIKKKIIIKTIENNTKIMITMTNMNKIIIKINKDNTDKGVPALVYYYYYYIKIIIIIIILLLLYH